MRRLVTLAAVVPSLLLPASALADAPDPEVETITGVVTPFLEEGTEELHQAVVTDDGIVPVEGEQLTAGTEVTVAVEDVPGPEHEVVEVLAEERVPLASTTVRHQVYVALVAPRGTSLSDPMPSAATVTSTINDKVDAYWSSQTGGQVGFTVAGTLPKYASAKGCDDPWGLWNEAATKFGGAATGAAKHVLLVLPESADRVGCAAGMAGIGSSAASGGSLYVAYHASAVYAHELGHNMGLGHASSLVCSTRQDTTVSSRAVLGHSDCRRHEYDDWLEVMSSSGGARGTGSLNGAHLDDMGLLPGAITGVTPGTVRDVRLAPLSSGSGVRVAKAVDATGATYFVQYRNASGRDAGKVPSGYRLGVELHREDPSSYRTSGSLFLDATPTGSTGDGDRALPVGSTFRSVSGTVAVRVVSQDSTGATVRIANGVPLTAPDPGTATDPGTDPGTDDPVTAQAVPTSARVAAPWSVRRRALFTVRGTVLDQYGAAAPRVTAYLQRKVRGTTTWRTVAQDGSDASGRLALATRTRKGAYYRWVVKATDDRQGFRSRTVLVRLR